MGGQELSESWTREMDRIVYCAGAYVAEKDAHISIFDRGYLFGDAVYEVTAVINGRMVDNGLHLARLERSLSELSIPMPLPGAQIETVQKELIARNGLQEGTVYLQVSRGEADRDFLYPEGLSSTLIAFTQQKQLVGTRAQREGISVDVVGDPRWARRDIKTAMLLGQVLSKRDARLRGFDDVWFLEDETVTEGSSSTAYIVTADNRIITRNNSHSILPGCTRQALIRLCRDHGIHLEERPFGIEEACAAVEAFQTSASSLVTPVVRIGHVPVGDGKPGPMTRKLQSYYAEAVERL